MSSIISTPGGKYRAFLSHNGNRISKTFASKKAAQEWLDCQRADIATGDFIEPSSVTLGSWMLECLRYSKQRVKPTTLDAYKTYARVMKPLAGIRIQSLNAIQVQHLLDTISTAPMRLGCYRWMHSIMERAVKLQLIHRNIMNVVEPPKYTARRKDVFTKDEITRIFETMDKHPLYRPFFVLAFASGCRIGELLALKIQNVKADCIRIEATITRGRAGTPKTDNSNRDIPLPPNIIAMLRQTWESHGAILNGYVFTNNRNNKGQPIADHTLRLYWAKILRLAGVPYRNVHYIRHTHATQLLSNGVPILEVQHRLGHSNASITLNRYGHVLVDNKDKVLDAVNSLLTCNH